MWTQIERVRPFLLSRRPLSKFSEAECSGESGAGLVRGFALLCLAG